jgi:hypothetical protein
MRPWVLPAALLGMLFCAGIAIGQDPGSRIEAARQDVERAGIPVSLIDARVAEGRAKGVPLDRIATVVERRAMLLMEAREAMAVAQTLSAAELGAGADALDAGIGRGVLRDVIEGARSEDRAVAIAVLTYLHREAGVPVGQALQRVREAMGEGPEALRNLPGRAAAAQGRRGPPEGVGAGGPPGGRPPGAGQGQGPPPGVPGPGQRPGGGRPDGAGGGPGGGNPGGGNPGGGNRPGGGPG